MAEELDSGFNFVISVEIDWVSIWLEFLLKVGFEGSDNQSSFKISIRGEHFCGVHFLQF